MKYRNARSCRIISSILLLLCLLSDQNLQSRGSRASRAPLSWGLQTLFEYQAVLAFSPAPLIGVSTHFRDCNGSGLYIWGAVERTVLLDSRKGDDSTQATTGIRLNKVFKRTHSRREADRLIESGRVSVNGERVTSKGGFFVVPHVDEVSLDGRVVEGWEEMNYVGDAGNDGSSKSQAETKTRKHGSKEQQQIQAATNSGKSKHQWKPNHSSQDATTKTKTFEYIKYWKPRGVICTTDSNIPHNILEEIRYDGYDPPHRVYPVGRLDKDTSGLILLTSDGRLPNAALRREHKRPKVYEVGLDHPIQDSARVLEQLRNGVTISTETVRNGVRKTLTAPTEPCQVEQLTDRWIRITLKEGRNRQVRKMTQAVGYRTVELERVAFAGIPLEPGLRGPGDWDYLRGKELEIVKEIIEQAATVSEYENEDNDDGDDDNENSANDIRW
jgi:23S rRNA pseudouridine2604 synthase